MEGFKQVTPEDAEDRVKHTAKMIKEGAYFMETTSGNMMLDATATQIDEAWREMDREKEATLSAKIKDAADRVSRIASSSVDGKIPHLISAMEELKVAEERYFDFFDSQMNHRHAKLQEEVDKHNKKIDSKKKAAFKQLFSFN